LPNSYVVDSPYIDSHNYIELSLFTEFASLKMFWLAKKRVSNYEIIKLSRTAERYTGPLGFEAMQPFNKSLGKTSG
jgi:hypothetical protein